MNLIRGATVSISIDNCYPGDDWQSSTDMWWSWSIHSDNWHLERDGTDTEQTCLDEVKAIMKELKLKEEVT